MLTRLQEGDAALKLSALQLLDSVLEDQDRGLSLGGDAASAVLSQLLLPPLIWQAGKSAAAGGGLILSDQKED